MKISVVVRALNEENNIGNCLEALSKQTFKPFEVLVVDNNSSDSTLAITETFKSKLPLLILNNPVRGFASGLNMGVEASNGDWIAYLSADCIPDRSWLYWLAKTAKELHADVVHDREILEPDNYIHFVLRLEAGPPQKNPTRIKFFSNTNVLYKRSTLMKHYPFTGVGKLGYAEDTIMSVKYQKANNVAYVEPRAISYSNQFPSRNEFKVRMILHGKMAVQLFRYFPKYPRLYLNSPYWVSREIFLFFTLRDVRILKVAWLRFIYTSRGAISGIFTNGNYQKVG